MIKTVIRVTIKDLVRNADHFVIEEVIYIVTCTDSVFSEFLKLTLESRYKMSLTTFVKKKNTRLHDLKC